MKHINMETFANGELSRQINRDIETVMRNEGVAEGLTEQYGGRVSDWQHAKGFGTLLDPDTGEELEAEVHWFQAKDVGKVKFKVKEWLDEG